MSIVEKLGRERINFWIDSVESSVKLGGRSTTKDMLLMVLTAAYNQCVDDVQDGIPPQYSRISQIVESKRLPE